MSSLWESAIKIEVTRELLDRYLVIVSDLDIEALESGFPETERASGAALMKLQGKDWVVAEELDDEQLISLIRFFTKAEMQLSGWDAGKTSPVIYLAKILKRRGSFDSDFKKWIKANTDNRYLPNGAVAL